MKILIIEDDEIALCLLTEIFEKYFAQIEIEGCFSEAEAALEFLQHTSVDLIITDIKLPEMNGIEFAEICTEKYPLIPIILLSAYNDFEYARKAINTSVVSYILKPVTYDNLCNAINLIESKSFTAKYTNFVSFSTIERYSDLLNGYFTGKIHEWNENNSDIPKDLIIKNISVLSLTILEYENYIKQIWHHGAEKLKNAINNILHSVVPGFSALVLSCDDEKVIIACLFEDKGSKGYIGKISDLLHHTLKMRCSINELLCISPIENIKNNVSEYKINKMLYEFFESEVPVKISAAELSLEELRYMAYVLSENFVRCVGVEYASKINFDITDYKNISGLEEMRAYVNKVIDSINNYKKINCDNSVEKAVKFIEANYHEKLTLTIVAEYVSLSPKYFSRLFKKKTNKNVSDYIEEVRINRAMELLQNNIDIKSYNLSEKLGYDAYSTFYNNFKKYTGLTPTQYVKSLKDN